MGDLGCHSVRDAVSFVSHDNQTVRCQRRVVDVVSIEESAVDGEVRSDFGLCLSDELREIDFVYLNSSKCSHRSLYDFGIVDVCTSA